MVWPAVSWCTLWLCTWKGQHMRIVIIGSGVMGLTLGRLLPGAVICERAPFIGGSARSLEHQGFHFDLGLHVLGRPDPDMAKFLCSVLGEAMVEIPYQRPRLIVHEDGRTWNLPVHPRHFPWLPDPLHAMRIRLNHYFRRLFPIRPVRTYRDLLINSGGDTYYHFFSEKAWTKNFGLPPDRLFLIATRSPGKGHERLRMRALRRLRRIGKRTETFFYPRPSFGTLVEKLAEGLDIRCDTEITRIHFERKRIVALEISGAGTVACDALALAIPGHLALQLFDAPDEVCRSARAIRYRDLIYVVLFFTEDHLLQQGYGCAVGQEIFGAFCEPKHIVPGCCPPGQTWVGFYISCFRTDPIWHSPDEEIMRRVLADFRRYYPGVTPSTGTVLRIPRFTLLLDPELEIHLRTVHGYLSSFENLHLPDCLVPLRGDRTYAAIDEAFRIAEEITLRPGG